MIEYDFTVLQFIFCVLYFQILRRKSALSTNSKRIHISRSEAIQFYINENKRYQSSFLKPKLCEQNENKCR